MLLNTWQTIDFDWARRKRKALLYISLPHPPTPTHPRNGQFNSQMSFVEEKREEAGSAEGRGQGMREGKAGGQRVGGWA